MEKVVWYNGMVGQTGPKKSGREGRRKKKKQKKNTCLVPEVCNFHKIGCVSSRKDLPTHELVYAQNAFNSLGKTQSMQFVISALRCPFHNWLRCLSISRMTRPCALLTPSLPWCHLKTTNKSAKSETLKPFCLLFRTGVRKDVHQNAEH